MVNSMGTRFNLMVLFALGFVSCDVQDSPHQTSVSIAPRFSAEQKLPRTIWVRARLKSASGVDTTRTVAYARGGQITLGTLPAGTEFSIEMTGYDTSSGGLVATWWTRASDTSGSAPVRTVALPAIQSAGSPTDSLVEEQPVFQGDTLRFPPGTWITFDQSDPRTSASATLAPTTFPVDSHPHAKTAKRIDGENSSGRPVLWSEVVEFAFPIDPLDTITSLDTLHLSTMDHFNDTTDFGAEENAIYQTAHQAGVLFRVDTLGLAIGPGPNEALLHVYATTTSPRAVMSIDGRSIPKGAFTEVSFPADSQLVVKVENHGRTRTYAVRLVKGWTDAPLKKLQGLAATVDGLRANSLDDRSWTLGVAHDMVAFSMIPTFPSDFRLRLGNVLWRSGDSIPVSVPKDSTLTFWIVDSLGDPAPSGPYSLQVIHAPRTITFRDTTWGVSWRDVPYDTLVDARNGRKYRTVVVGKSRWMAENLNFRRDSSFCPGATDSCSKYGRWYRWAAAADTSPDFDAARLASTAPLKGICPSGWHLPSESEWRDLVMLLGTSKSATLLRSAGSSWTSGGGEDSLGYRGLPAGRRYIDAGSSVFYRTEGLGTDAFFWTSTQSSLNATQAITVRLSGGAPAVDFVSTSLKSNAQNIRCVENAAP